MRAPFVLMLLLSLAGCTAPDKEEKVERIVMRLSGWSSVDVEIDDQGNGSYRLSEPFPNGRGGKFRIDRAKFQSIAARLEAYRQRSVPFSEASAWEFVNRTCPKGTPHVTDEGALYLIWTTENSQQHFLADFGCDYKRYGRRNRELLGVLEALPVPFDD